MHSVIGPNRVLKRQRQGSKCQTTPHFCPPPHKIPAAQHHTDTQESTQQLFYFQCFSQRASKAPPPPLFTALSYSPHKKVPAALTPTRIHGNQRYNISISSANAHPALSHLQSFSPIANAHPALLPAIARCPLLYPTIPVSHSRHHPLFSYSVLLLLCSSPTLFFSYSVLLLLPHSVLLLPLRTKKSPC